MYKKNDKIAVHAYKYNGWLYRVWEFPTILEVNDEYLCVGNKNAKVITSDKNSDRVFTSKVFDKTYWVFFKHQWFNILISYKKDKYHYYINLASPFIYEEGTIKYIDFDLDFVIQDINDGNFKELDVNEFGYNGKIYHYPPAIKSVIKSARDEVIDLITSGKLKKNYGSEFFEKMENFANERKTKYGKNW